MKKLVSNILKKDEISLVSFLIGELILCINIVILYISYRYNFFTVELSNSIIPFALISSIILALIGFTFTFYSKYNKFLTIVLNLLLIISVYLSLNIIVTIADIYAI